VMQTKSSWKLQMPVISTWHQAHDIPDRINGSTLLFHSPWQNRSINGVIFVTNLLVTKINFWNDIRLRTGE
jgi:hypothetical protein